jgi:hypothetical protein
MASTNFAAAEVGDPTQLRHVDQPQGREHHNGRQGSHGKAGKNWPEGKKRNENDCQRDQRMKLSATAGGIADGGSAAAAAHREALQAGMVACQRLGHHDGGRLGGGGMGSI